MSYSQVLRTPDEYVTNYIYTYNPFSKADDRITLISIDSDTTDKYGDYSNWDRSLLSKAVDILSDNDTADDNNNYDDIPKDSNMNLAKPADSSMDWSTHSAIGITFPYDDLRNVVTVGISNAMHQSDDGSIRSAALTVNYDSSQDTDFSC